MIWIFLVYTEQTKVIFSAVATAGDRAIGPFDEDTTLIYNMVLTSIGNAYNPSTGNTHSDLHVYHCISNT